MNLALRFESNSNGNIAFDPCGVARARGFEPFRCQDCRGGVSLGRRLARVLAVSWEEDARLDRRARARGVSAAGRAVLAEDHVRLLQRLGEADAAGRYPADLIAEVAKYLGADATFLEVRNELP